ncbi:MAG: hypothetical protein GXP45_03170 [bacterium]|nr:hypothetical protein [bacterium]
MGSVSHAQMENNDLIDAIQKNDDTQLQKLQEQISFSQFSSCLDMDTVLGKFLENFKDQDHFKPPHLLR